MKLLSRAFVNIEVYSATVAQATAIGAAGNNIGTAAVA